MNSHAHLLFTGPHQSSVTVIPNLLVCLSYPILLLKPFPFSFPIVLVIGCLHTNPSIILANHLFQHYHLMLPLLLFLFNSPLHVTFCAPVKWKHLQFPLACHALLWFRLLFCGGIMFPILFTWWAWTLRWSSLLDSLSWCPDSSREEPAIFLCYVLHCIS